MRLTQIFIVFTFLFLFSFCKKKEVTQPTDSIVAAETPQPKAGFTASKYFPKTGESVKFTNTSKDAETYKWDFGDGEKSTEASPEHIYKTKGVYKVSLKSIHGDKIATKETTVYCDMLASVKITFWASNFKPLSNWPNPGLSIEYTTSLYKYPDTVKALVYKEGSEPISNYQIQHIVSYTIPDELNSYLVKCSVRVTGFTSGPNPDVDYIFQKRIASFFTDTFNIFGTTSLNTSTKQFEYIDINYQMAPVEYN